MKEKKSKILWKVYFWFMILSSLSIAGFILYSDQEVFVEDNIFTNMYDIVFLCISIFSLIGLYGFIYEKKYFNKQLWMFILVILVIEEISELVLFVPNYLFLYVGVFYVLIIPFYYALYKYAFKMNHIWSIDNE